MSVTAFIECRGCDGAGEITVCVNDGPSGCSHVNDYAYVCRDCDGDGQVALKPGFGQPEEAPPAGGLDLAALRGGASLRRDWPVAFVIAVVITGCLIFLALYGQAQRLMCATHHDQPLRYCATYTPTETAR